MAPEEIASYWGDAHLRTWPEAALTGASIPPSARRFLADVGMPSRKDWTLDFNVAPVLSRTEDGRGCVIFGVDGGVAPLCIDDTGSVRSLGCQEDGVSPLFVNR